MVTRYPSSYGNYSNNCNCGRYGNYGDLSMAMETAI